MQSKVNRRMRFEQENSSGKDWRHFVSGGVAGAISRSCTAPADRLKILLQVHGSRKQTSVTNTMRYMVKEGGFTGDALRRASLRRRISSFAFLRAVASVASDAEGTTSLLA